MDSAIEPGLEPRVRGQWRSARSNLAVTHLDAAAAGVPSDGVLAAQAAHLAREATIGSYVAQYEAADRLAAARGVLAELLDPALGADDISFHHGAQAAFSALLAAWPLPRGARVGVVPSDFCSNWLALRARADRDALEMVDLPVHPDGRIDVERLAAGGGPAALDRLDLVTFPEVPSQRGIVQPTAAVAALCRDAGVPLLLDVAQSLGQVDVTVAGATGGVTAYAGTSRKWLCGPRGVGFLAVRPEFVDRLGLAAATGYTSRWAPDDPAEAAGRSWPRSGETGGHLVPAAGIGRFQVGEASFAAWLGLATALHEYATTGPATARAGIQALARAARHRLAGVAGWRLGEDADSPAGIVTLLPPPGVAPATIQATLRREANIVVSAIDHARARDAVPSLRVSPHLYSTVDDLDTLAVALEKATSTR
jgi:pyridoxal 5-phosphate dependent beta-lyase